VLDRIGRLLVLLTLSEARFCLTEQGQFKGNFRTSHGKLLKGECL
jgi:hypothetical protein